MSDDSSSARPDVELRLPADGAYASVLRTTAAGLAARLDFTMDDIEDLRIAIGEASAMVLPDADPESDLTCVFFLEPRRMTIEVVVDSAEPPEPDLDSFAWQVLSTLATEAEVLTDGGRLRVRLTMESSLAGAGL
ncbi:anti-sigma factor [Nocardioides sp. InS609-2]|uniref:anti-sigma factor n=1 Tax=Nocardioides sp. InS609-2 TaxID=2760705 RepID=UPI0018420AD7|nr:anti-sigma factor [Nocardioides sp. InS609-2]MBA3780642.1 anti-sigma factor [Nocardioides sp.]